MFCEKCGNMLNDNEAFCPQCGNKVNPVISSNSEFAEESAQKEETTTNDKAAELTDYEILNKKKKGNSNSLTKEIVIMLTTFSVVAAIFVGFYFYISEECKKASLYAEQNNYEMAYEKVKNLPTEKTKVLKDYYTLMYNAYEEAFDNGEEEEISVYEAARISNKLPEKYDIANIESEADRLSTYNSKSRKYMSEEEYENAEKIKECFNTDNCIADINSFEDYIDDAFGLYAELDRLNDGKKFKPEEEKEIIHSFLTYLDYALDIYNTYTAGPFTGYDEIREEILYYTAEINVEIKEGKGDSLHSYSYLIYKELPYEKNEIMESMKYAVVKHNLRSVFS